LAAERRGSQGPSLSFSLPHLNFYRRCRAATQCSERWLPLPCSHVERRALKQLAKALDQFDELPRLAWAVPKLESGTRSALSRVLNGRAAISLDIALRLEAWLGEQRGGRAEVWLAQQMAYDVWHARQKSRAVIARVPDA
jgi:hypothetical protein